MLLSTENAPGMFATLVICLPSSHEGGAVRLQHGKELKEFRTDNQSRSFLCWSVRSTNLSIHLVLMDDQVFRFYSRDHQSHGWIPLRSHLQSHIIGPLSSAICCNHNSEPAILFTCRSGLDAETSRASILSFISYTLPGPPVHSLKSKVLQVERP